MIESASIYPIRSNMDYKNTEIKLEVLVSLFNEERINLNPVFQRGTVWELNDRRQIIKNIIAKRPIPAIFLYRDVDGSASKYNVLDGKQRLESILLFVGYNRADFKINTWDKYIPVGSLREQFNFSAPIGPANKLIGIKELDPSVVLELRDYLIPVIEIDFNEKTSIDELITLFVDINQQGVKVTRLQIVRALKRNDKFLKDVYGLIAEKRVKHQAVVAKRRNTDFSFVLGHLQNIANVMNLDQKVDRMWERLFELALFARSGKHRKPTEILKSFINAPTAHTAKLSVDELSKLRRAFSFLATNYRNGFIIKTRFCTDQTHFYTLATTLLGTRMLDEYEHNDLAMAIFDFDAILNDPKEWKVGGMTKLVRQYQEISAKQTSDSTRREGRQKLFEDAVEILVKAKSGKKKKVDR